MKPPENARAAQQGGPHADDLKAGQSHAPALAGKDISPGCVIDNNDARAKAVARRLGAYDEVVRVLASGAGPRGGMLAGGTLDGWRVFVLAFAGHARPEDNGWAAMWVRGPGNALAVLSAGMAAMGGRVKP